MDFRGAFNAVTKPFRKPEGYVSAKEEQAARPPAPTPPPAQPQMQIGGMNTGANEKREKAAGMKDGGMVARGVYRPKMMQGGMVRGPGTGTSDSIPATVPKGSYIMPADSTEEVNLSNGELQLPPEAVMAVGAAVLDAVRNATHEFAAGDAAEDAAEGEPHAEGYLMAEDAGSKEDTRGFKNGGCVTPARGAMRKGYADGGMVTDEERRRLSGVSAIPGQSYPAPAATGVDQGTEFSRNVGNTLMALPGASPALGAMRALSAASKAGQMAGAVASPVVDMAKTVAPYAAPVGGFAALQSASQPATATAPPAAMPRPAATQPVTQPDSIRSTGQPIAPSVAAPAPGAIISPARGVYGNVTGDTAFENRGAISPQNDAAATALDARYRQQAAGERAMAEQAAAADPRAILMGQMKAMADRNQTFSARGAQVLAGMAQTDATSRDAAGRLALEGRRMASGAEESSARTQLTQQQIAAAQRLGKLQAKLQSTTDEGERERIREQILLEQGKDRNFQPRIQVVGGGTNPDGSKNPDIPINVETGQVLDVQRAAQPLPNHVAALKKDPKLAAQFDQQYGPGAAARYLGTK